MLAKIQGVFRLTRDAELKYIQSGQALIKLGLACSEKYKDKETTLFIDAVSFGKPAELINQYSGQKGSQIFLSGKLQTEQWVDQNQQKRSKISMTIESFEFLGGRSDNQGGGDSYNQAPQQQAQSYPNNGGRYDDPPQAQPMGYDRKPYQSSPSSDKEQPQSQMPSADSIPEIDIDEDEIPF